jgi:hypothetical protein
MRNSEDIQKILAKALYFLLDDNEGVVVKHQEDILIVASVGDAIDISTSPKDITEEHVGHTCVLCADKAEAITKATLDPNGEVVQTD